MVKFLGFFIFLFSAKVLAGNLNSNLTKIAPAAFGVDTTSAIDSSQASCFARAGYKAGFFRIANRGETDQTGIANVLNFYDASLAFEVFVTPSPLGYADRQFEQAYQFARLNNLNLNRLWLQITSPIQWDRLQSANVRFINDFVRAGKARNVRVGFYTNWYDYEEITGNSRAIDAADLWYWHVLGGGANGETARDFNDFRSFGPFLQYPLVKQYGVGENPCSVLANQNVFAAGSFKSSGAMEIGMGASVMGKREGRRN